MNYSEKISFRTPTIVEVERTYSAEKSAEEWIDEFKKIAQQNSIHLEAITVSMGVEHDYGDDYGVIKLEFLRAATAKEIAEEEQKKAKQLSNSEAAARRQYEELKKRFG